MNPKDLERFRFRNLHPRLFLGTASDRYAGWIGQVYAPGRWDDRITRRSHAVGGQTFTEQVLPVESAAEYFTHFPVLEIDATFYSPLLDAALKPTPTLRLLETYARHLTDADGLILKAPQAVFARILRRLGRFEENPAYLDADLFARRFYEPAVKLLGARVKGFIFEQEYQAKEGRNRPEDLAERLGAFFAALPRDDRYHLELRTEALLQPAYFKVLEDHGLGQVLSHWTWLPSLNQQLDAGGRRFFSASGRFIIRLVTPRRMAYEKAYRQAFPYDRLVEGMTDPRMIEEAVSIAREAIGQDRDVFLIVNNRAGGNAPLIARALAERFLAETRVKAGGGEKADARPTG